MLRIIILSLILGFYVFLKAKGESYNIVFIGNSITYGATHKVPSETAPPNECARWLMTQEGVDSVYYINCGRSGKTTFHFLPDRLKVLPAGDPTYFNDVVKAANRLNSEHPGCKLIFSIMLGTNDSAERPRNHRTTPMQYVDNMTAIIDSLLTLYPRAHIVLHRVIYYTPGFITGHGSILDNEGLDHLDEYYQRYPEIVAKAKEGHVHIGDTLAYDYFKTNFKTDATREQGRNGEVYYLHPNESGARALGIYWGKAIHNIISTTYQPVHSSNVLADKKWIVCGDSFSYGDFHNGELGSDSKAYKNSDKYFDKEWNMYKTYPWHIGKRNGMSILNESICGTCMASSSRRKDNFVDGRYKRLPPDADYITLWFGINDCNHQIPIGEPESTDTTTFYGAWNTVLEYLIDNHPYAKIGIIVTTGTSSEYSEAERIVARRWGIPYLDLNDDPAIPLTIRVRSRAGLCEQALKLRTNQLQVSPRNTHPNLKAHELLSTIIENFLRTL